MTELLGEMTAQGIVAFSRIAGCFMMLPGFASVRVPQQFRILFVLALTGVLIPLIHPLASGVSATNKPTLVYLIFTETVIGAVIGICVRYYVQAVSFMATAASSAIGFSALVAPSVVDSEMEPALGSIISMATLVLIFETDFHHSIILSLMDSYLILPIGAVPDFGTMASDLVRVLSDSFLIVFRLGSPFLAYAILANGYIALMNKLAPSLPIFFVATPAVIMGGLAVAYLVLPGFLSFVGQGLSELRAFH